MPMTAPALDAPVRSLEMLDLQVAAGATEIYVGLMAPQLNVLTFNAHARVRDDQPTQVSSPELLAEIIQAAHQRGLKVHFSANIAYLPASLHGPYLDHVQQAIALGVDTIIVGNIGLMKVIRDAGVTFPLVAAGYMGVTTTAFARYLRDTFGVTRVVLPHAMTLDEIAAFTALPDLEIEIPVQTGAGNSCGRCMMFDSPVKPEIGLGCRAGYMVRTPEGKTLEGYPLLDGSTDCAFCSIGAVVAAGVHALKIPGRESPNLRTNAKITQLYRQALDGTMDGKPIELIVADIDRVELMWQMSWVPRFCDNKRCRFLETPTTLSYV